MIYVLPTCFTVLVIIFGIFGLRGGQHKYPRINREKSLEEIKLELLELNK